MKQICGYKGLDGKFYEDEEDCRIADLEYEIADVRSILENFHTEVEWIIRRHSAAPIDVGDWGIREDAIRVSALTILKHSEDFIRLINKKKYLYSHLDELKSELSKVKHKGKWSLLRKLPWWLETEWWK